MAKQLGIIQFTGKLGEVVGQKSATGKQILRKRVTDVANPKTTSQASQRYKMLPAQRIAGALKEIIDRGQQGVKYGVLSRNEFMKRALKMTTGFPYMEKDDSKIIPGMYQITKGTLPEVAVTVDENNNFITSLVFTSEEYGNVGHFSQSLIEDNPWLQEGDQITIVAFSNGTPIMPYYKSLILNTASEDDLGDFMDNGCYLLSRDQENHLMFDETSCAIGVIISRPNGANGYLRSNCTLAVATVGSQLSPYFSTAGKQSALQTYEGDTTVANNTNWPIDIDNNGGASGASEVTENVLHTLTSENLASGAPQQIIGKQILVGKGANTGLIKKIFYVTRDEDQCCIDANGDPVSYTVSENSHHVTVNDLADAFKSGKTLVDYEA